MTEPLPVIVDYVVPARPDTDPPDPDVLKPIADGMARAMQFSLIGMVLGLLALLIGLLVPRSILLSFGAWLSIAVLMLVRRGWRGAGLGLLFGVPVGFAISAFIGAQLGW